MTGTVVLPSDEHSTISAAAASTPSPRILCRVCEEQYSRYRCPRCNFMYCSLPCYKSHSLRCTESFMRENVMDGMKQLEPDGEAKLRMLRVLKRFHDQSADADPDPPLSDDTIEKVLSGMEIDLPPNERRRFERALVRGDLSRMIEPWDPWWTCPAARSLRLSCDGTPLVRTLADDDTVRASSAIPPGSETPLPPVGELTSSEPSPSLPLHLVDILYAYCFTLRLYNGDPKSDAVNSALLAVTSSRVLSGRQRSASPLPEVLSSCMEHTCSPAYRDFGGSSFALCLVDDVVGLVSLGGHALVCSLCDLRRLLLRASREHRGCCAAVRRAERKVYFMTCWVHHQPATVWQPLAALIISAKAELLGPAPGSFNYI